LVAGAEALVKTSRPTVLLQHPQVETAVGVVRATPRGNLGYEASAYASPKTHEAIHSLPEGPRNAGNMAVRSCFGYVTVIWTLELALGNDGYWRAGST
jgi:hypothetical protein